MLCVCVAVQAQNKSYAFEGTYWSPVSHGVLVVGTNTANKPSFFYRPAGSHVAEALKTVSMGADTLQELAHHIEHFYTFRRPNSQHISIRLQLELGPSETLPRLSALVKPSQGAENEYLMVSNRPDSAFREDAHFRTLFKGTFADPANQQLLLFVPDGSSFKAYFSERLAPFKPVQIRRLNADSSYVDIVLAANQAPMRLQTVYGPQGIAFVYMHTTAETDVRAYAFVEQLPNLSPHADVRDLLMLQTDEHEDMPTEMDDALD